MPNSDQPKPTEAPVFPTFPSLAEAESYAYAQIPVNDRNRLYGVLQSYRNTVLKLLDKPVTPDPSDSYPV